MKRIIVMMSIIVIMMPSLGARAQQPPQEKGSQDTQQNQPQNQAGFVDAKRKIAQRIHERIGKMQKRLSCVENAQNTNALHACFPVHMERNQDHPSNVQADGYGDGDDDDDDDD